MSHPLDNPSSESGRPQRIETVWDAQVAASAMGYATPQEAFASSSAAKGRIAALEEALGWFLADPRFVVAVGGNPLVVDRMIAQARALLPEQKRENG